MTDQLKKLPYLTEHLAGIGGRIKETSDDFLVDEQSLYEPSGEGTHVYFRIRKVGIPTPVAVDRIARYMGVEPRNIGLAGMKDAHAVTTQMLSLEHADSKKIAAYKDPQLKVIWTGTHGNKLRPGHLAGNRFCIKIRGVGTDQLDAARAIFDVMIEKGVPNYFGPQRFGLRGDTGKLGKFLITNDLKSFIELYLGQPQADDPTECKAARDAFDTGNFNRAKDLWPRHYANERKALSAYKKKKRPGPAVGAIDRRMKKLYVSAFQSEMFNEVLTARMPDIDKVFAGDLAQKTDTGGVFTVEDVQADQVRADKFEISSTGPIFGYRSSLATGEPGKIEEQVLDGREMSLEEFRNVGSMKLKGTRRPLRFRLEEADISAGLDERGEFLELVFAAPSGCYATVVVSEITKDVQAG